ncbi:MAG: peptidoglycan-binding domain-containing protein [Hoeflea sp.]
MTTIGGLQYNPEAGPANKMESKVATRARSGTIVSTVAMAMALSVSTTVVVPDTAQAFDFKKVGKTIRKDFNKARKNLNKDGVGKRIVQGVGVGLLVGGIAGDSPAAAIVGVALIAAPEVFREDMARRHGTDMAWSGCTRCYKQRIIVAPGREVSKKKRSALSSQVKEDIKDIQHALATLGLYKMRVDGDFGPGSRAAVKQFQSGLGEPETGYLTAEQRYLLFVRASEEGYAREAALNRVDEDFGPPVIVRPETVAAPAVPAIPEYRLAQSQFDRFAEDFLMSGSLTAVRAARLQPDGSAEIEIMPANGGESRTVNASITDIEINPHDLSDQWVRIAYSDPALGPVPLNTRDDFATVEEASAWMSDGRSKMSVLAKLTGAEEARTEIAESEGQPEDKSTPGNGVEVAEGGMEAASPPADEPTISVRAGEATAGADGRIVLADSVMPVTTVADQSPEEEPREAGGSGGAVTLIDDVQATSVSSNSLSGFEDVAGKTCRQSIYISFQFPNGDYPISHFNILPPEGTIMMDNGDSTAYFTGSCIQGDYDFSYVAIEEGKSESDWKDFKREGSFEIASNSEQCSINLNTPDGSASLQCY